MGKIELCLHFRFICFSCRTFYYTFEGMKVWKLCGNWIDRLVLVASIQNVLVLVLWCRKCLFVVVLVSFTTLRIIFFMSNLNIQIWTNTNYNISTANKKSVLRFTILSLDYRLNHFFSQQIFTPAFWNRWSWGWMITWNIYEYKS